MASKSWKDTAELIGITAIVASLIFVGLQMRQSQEIAIADQYQDRADAALEWYLARIQNDTAMAITANRISDNANSTSSSPAIKAALESDGPEIVAFRYLEYRSNLTMFDNYHFQYERGFLTEDAWRAYRVRLKGVLTTPVTAAMYRQQTTHWRQSFQDLCTQILAEIDTESK